MVKIVAVWLFAIGVLADVFIVLLKLLDWISWGWEIIIAFPFALAFVGALCFSIIYGIIKFFVTLIMMF